MRSRLAARLALLLSLALPGWQARAMQFDPVETPPTGLVISGRGPIIKGDAARLEQVLASIPRPPLALALDSPGGNVAEAHDLAGIISAHRLAVVIPASSQCVSACFLMLAASPRRFAAPDALVGVHSASENGEETDTSLAFTTLMARYAADMGIPPTIIGKMVETTPGRVAWLTREDLASMDVAVLGADTRPDASLATSQAAPQRALVPTSPPAQATLQVPGLVPGQGPGLAPGQTPGLAGEPAGFAAGQNDRRAWNAWLSGLQGQYREGAVFAETQLGQPSPGSCFGANGINRGDFTLGCTVARQRLAQVAVRLAGNPAYARGWTGAGPPEPVGGLSEAEYQGAYFCGRQMARLDLKLFPATDDPRRRAILSFGPQPTSPDVPRGAFIVEGSIDLGSGAMTFAPVKWVTQPPGYGWLGLNGHSDDNGKTFSGRVIEHDACTVFTLRRVNAVAAAK
jgi:hypothetical protein